MRSIRTKIITITLCTIVFLMLITTAVSTVAIRDLGNSSSKQILDLLCETGQKNLDSYFNSIEQSVEMVSSYAESDLSRTEIENLDKHIDRMREVFEKTARSTSGILTYYYRIDPKVSETNKGFWYVDLDGKGFTEHEVTDITQYDTEDTTKLVWYTVPKATGRSVWLEPYITDNLDKYVLSYNTPIYKGDRFIGVIGIELDYDTIVGPVNSISIYGDGYAFINNNRGDIIYHPHIDIAKLIAGNKPQVPDGLLSDSSYITYTYEGVKKQAVWLPLNNGMRINVCVPEKEINKMSRLLVLELITISLVLLVIFIIVMTQVIKHITDPLQKLTEAAKQVDSGNYYVELDYEGNDEVGVLTRTVNNLIKHLRVYISDLNSLAYADALTSVRNKGAFDIYIREIQSRVNAVGKRPEFAIGIFDCNYLKAINDKYGHDKGDIYLKTTSELICKVFNHSPVFRIGGDEFAAILRSEDYKKAAELEKEFMNELAELARSDKEHWEKVSVAVGIAFYDPETDLSVDNVIRRADKLMYINKKKNRDNRKI